MRTDTCNPQLRFSPLEGWSCRAAITYKLSVKAHSIYGPMHQGHVFDWVLQPQLEHESVSFPLANSKLAIKQLQICAIGHVNTGGEELWRLWCMLWRLAVHLIFIWRVRVDVDTRGHERPLTHERLGLVIATDYQPSKKSSGEKRQCMRCLCAPSDLL